MNWQPVLQFTFLLTLLLTTNCTPATVPSPSPTTPAPIPTGTPQVSAATATTTPSPAPTRTFTPTRPPTASPPLIETTVSISAVDSLEVIEVQPPDRATGITHRAIVTIFFNRPVVFLKAIEDTDQLPNPLTFDPLVEGIGEWLNTSTFQFTPGSAGFRRATHYTARITAGLSDAFGEAVLAQDVEWTFSTIGPTVTPTPTVIPTPAPPLVTDISPANKTTEVSPHTGISLTFNKPMFRQNVQNNFRLVEVGSSQPVTGTFTWRDSPESFTFMPANSLTPATVYRLELPAGTQAEYGRERLPTVVESTFTVAPNPKVETTFPSPGGIFDPGDSIRIDFNTTIDPGSIIPGKTLLITPTVPITQVYTYWQSKNNYLVVNLPLDFSRNYTLTLRRDVANPHGQQLGQDFSLSWQTRAQAALLFVESPGHIATYNAYTDTVALLSTRNISRVDLALYHLPLADLISFTRDKWRSSWKNYQPRATDLFRSWAFEPDNPPNTRKSHRLNFSQYQGVIDPLPPGIYYLEAKVPANALYSDAGWTSNADPEERQVLVVSNYNITLKESGHETLAWLTDLQSGQPVADVPVTFINGTSQAVATTNTDGVALSQHSRWHDPSEFRLAVAGDPQRPGDDFALAFSQWGEGITRYDYQNIETENAEPRYTGHFYTHRPLYRPGETVHFKGIIRAGDDANYALPEQNRQVTVVVEDDQGNEVYHDALPLSKMGTVNDTLELAEDTALGDYQIRADYAGQTFFDTFEVSAYRPPEFSVAVQTDHARYVQDDPINVTVSANFFFGGSVADAHVRWSLLSDDFAPNASALNAFDFVNEAYGDDYIENLHGGFGPLVAQGEGITGPDGRFTFEVMADIASRLSTQLYTFDVVVTDINNQEVAGQVRVLVNKGNFLVGVRPEQFVGRAGQENQANVLVVDWAGQPVVGQPVEVVWAEYNRYSFQRLDPDQSYYSGRDSYYWDTVDDEVPVFTTTVTTGSDGQAVTAFTPPTGGIYKIYARATDSDNNGVQTSAFAWVSGDDYINWGQRDNDRFALIADQKSYQVGDTARLLIPHPFAGPTTALVTFERGHIYNYQVVNMPTNSTLLNIPITEAMLPNMYISVVVMPQVDETNPLPAFAMGYLNLPIDSAEKALNISLTPDRTESYQPRDTVAYDVEMTNARGEPVQAELSLALVDQAVLSLAPEKPGQILQDFWHSRGLAVETASGLILAIDRFNQAVFKAKGGGGGCVDCGGFEKGFGQTRLNLLDTALWVADFITDENGHGTVETTLPDNLTTWTLTGIGVTGADTLVGENSVDIISAKPLLVRPVTPRFFVVGDEAQVGIIVQNTTEEDLDIEAKFEAAGLDIEAWRVGQPAESGPVDTQGNAWSSQGNPTFTLAAGQRLRVDYQVTVMKVEAVRLTMGAKSTDNLYGDALEFPLPVYQASTPETVATAGQLEADGTRSEGIALPDSFDPTQGNLTVDVAPSLAAGMRDGLTYLEHFPYECTEQTVSRFLPNAVTYRAYKALNLDNPELAERLPELLSVGVQRLYQYRNYDGGWGWWANDPSAPTMTAYVLQGLVEAERAGFPVSDSVIDGAVNYLEKKLKAPNNIHSSGEANQQAFILYVLAEAGHGDLGRSVALFEQRRRFLDLFSKAYLAMALYLLDEDAPQIETLISDILSAAVSSASGTQWTEQQVDRRAMNTDTRTTAIVIAALARIRPDYPGLPNAVRWLMSARGAGGYWATTQETAWSILGLTDWMVASGELEGSYNWRVTLNDDELGNGEVGSWNIDESTRLRVEVADLLVDSVNRLAFERTAAPPNEAGTGRMYYAAYLTYYKPVAEVTALDRGIRVTREYRLVTPTQPSPLEGEGQGGGTISEVGLGDLIEVRLTIEAPADLHYLVVEDPLPAGTEAINTSLATTSLVDQQLAESTGDDRGAFTHTELRDEKAALFATYLRRGTYHYNYLIRASLPGRYNVIPTHAQEMYFPEVFGRGEGNVFTISE